MDATRGAIGNVTATPELVKMAMAYSHSRVLCAAARLEIADALADEEHSVEELSVLCGADVDALYRLLRTLASLGITAETSPRRFVLSPFGQPLRKDVPNSVWAAVVFWSDLLADSWSHLTECIRSGRTAFEIMSNEGIPSRWASTPDSNAIFRAVMGSGPAEDYMPVAAAWDFGGCRVVADLGGGGGALIAAILSRNPQLRGMLVDRPESIEAASSRFDGSNLENRCQWIAADLRKDVPAGADVYLLKQVLHGYDDVAAGEILQNCSKAVPRDGRLLVIEVVLPDVVSGPDPELQARLLSDLNMLAVTGGRERSAAEWSTLLAACGFAIEEIVLVPGWDVSVIAARPQPEK